MSSPDRAARRRAERESEAATTRRAQRAGIVVPGRVDPNLSLDQRALRDKLGIPSEAQTDDSPRPIQLGATATPGGDDLDLTNAGKPTAGGLYSQEDFDELRQAALVLMQQMDEERQDTITVTAGLIMAAGGSLKVTDSLMETVGVMTQLRRYRVDPTEEEPDGYVLWQIVTPVGDCPACEGIGSPDGEHPCGECEGQGILFDLWTPA
jgi:hypothetical protein